MRKLVGAFLDYGIPVAGSSDYPCGPYQPLLALQSCVTRTGYDGTPLGLQLVSLHERLDADVPGGLDLVKSFGLTLVETAGTCGLTPEQFRAQIDAHGLKVNRHAFMESEISFYANAQVAATIPNLTTGNQIMHQLLAERLTTGDAPAIEGGRFRLGDAGGHGFDLDEDAVARAHERWQRDGAYNTIESVR